MPPSVVLLSWRFSTSFALFLELNFIGIVDRKFLLVKILTGFFNKILKEERKKVLQLQRFVASPQIGSEADKVQIDLKSLIYE